MAELQTVIKAKSISEMLNRLTGETPTVEYYSDHARIYFEPDRLKRAQQKIEMILSKKEPSDIRLEWLPLFTPMAIKKGWPFVASVLGVGILMGGGFHGKR